MRCSNCGAEIREGAQFCTGCGQPVIMPAQEAPSNPEQPVQAGHPMPRTRWIVIALVAIALVAAGVGGLLWWRHAQQVAAQKAYDDAHAEHAVTFAVSAPDYSDDTCTRIPLHVTGTDLDGNAVDENVYVDGEGTGASLVRGDYQVSVDASPLLGDGTIYAQPSWSATISIGDSIEPGDSVQAPTDQPISFTKPDETTVTDDEIQRAYNDAKADEKSASKADDLKQRATQVRDGAVAQKKAEEEAAKEAAEKAARTAKATVTTKYFTVQVPDSWVDTYSASVSEESGNQFLFQLIIKKNPTSKLTETVWFNLNDKSIPWEGVEGMDYDQIEMTDGHNAWISWTTGGTLFDGPAKNNDAVSSEELAEFKSSFSPR